MMLLLLSVAFMGAAEEVRPKFNGSGGTGTKDDPWLISSIKDMNELSRLLNLDTNSEELYGMNIWHHLFYWNGYFMCYFKLTCDLDYSNEPIVDGCNFIPIATNNYFGGYFDGDGHTISGIVINRPEKYNGIFGVLDGAFYIDGYDAATVKNLTLANCQITGGSYTGGIVGFCSGTVQNCHVLSSCTITAAADGTECVGGIVGKSENYDSGYMPIGNSKWDWISSRVAGCTNAATVSTGGKSGCSQFGGIVGGALGSMIHFNLNTGEVDTRTEENTSGGIIGKVDTQFYHASGDNYYTPPCTVGGESGEDTEGSRPALVSDTEPEGLGEYVYRYYTKSYDQPDMIVYENGLLYGGKYYYYDKSTGELFPLYDGDEGTELKPYQIKTTDDLRKLSRTVDYDTDYDGKFFVLTADLDFGGGEVHNFTPIGGKYNFAGTFDGQGHTISGIVVNRPGNNNGLFGQAGNIKNLTLDNSTIVGNCNPDFAATARDIQDSNTGGLVGILNGTVENCHVTSSVTVRTGGDYMRNFGGITGYAKGTILGCTSAATVTSEHAGSRNLGGIAGMVDAATLTHCISLGPVFTDNEWAGSVVGYNSYYGDEQKKLTKYEMCYYGGDSNRGGVENAEVTNVWKADERTSKPSAFMSKVSEYSSFDNVPGITVYKNCLYYDGIYYYHNSNAPASGSFPRYEGDEGTEEKPYQIKCMADMSALRNDVMDHGMDFAGKYFALKNDIDYGAYDHGLGWWDDINYVPIGNSQDAFCGVFDGEGHTLKGISMKDDVDSKYARYQIGPKGVFAYVGEGGVVKNLTLADSYVFMTSSSGGIVGTLWNGTVENCHVRNITARFNDYSTSYAISDVGGVVGRCRGDVRGCTNDSDLKWGDANGGIVGSLETGSVTDCLNLGAVNSGDTMYGKSNGGVVGKASEGTTVTNCYYGGRCIDKGIAGEDTDGARKAAVSTTKPEDIGDEVTVYPSYEGAPGLTAYTAGLFYDGKYYTPIPEGSGTEEVDVAFIMKMIFEGKYDLQADINNDGKVDVADIVALINQQHK